MSNPINSICKRVLKITDEDLAEMEAMAQQQAGYIHPLKCGTALRYQNLGDHNMAVLAKLRELRDTIKAGESIASAR